MAPEQISGGQAQIGPAADIYSLGATLYALLSGRPPFQAASTIDTLKQVVEQNPIPLREFDATIPRDVETIALKCLEKEPAKRYASGKELADDLTRFLLDSPIVARRATAPERIVRWCRRNTAVAALGGAAVMLLIVALAILAISNLAIRREAAAKDAALATARAAVDQMLTRVANDTLGHVPLAHSLRSAILQDALKFYENLLADAKDDPVILENMHGVLNSMGVIQRELGQFDEARRSLERSIELLAALIPNDPNPPTLREKLAATEKALAFTWNISPNPESQEQAELHFRRALELYQSLERDWPNRRQPVGLCLRHVADLAYQRGEAAAAERLWLESIAKGEAYAEQQPHDVNALCELSWSRVNLADAILLNSPDRIAEAEPLLTKSLESVDALSKHEPRSSQLREVSAILRFHLGRCYSGTERMDRAIPPFVRSADEMLSLCADFPTNDQYWGLVRFIIQKSTTSVQAASTRETTKEFSRNVAQRLDKIAFAHLHDESVQTQVARCREILLAQSTNGP
jgi:tetratricopeptide (TPR) repeat protein